jgi:hypothetical protein
MPILFIALLALLGFAVIGILCFAAVVAESRQAEKMARQQSSSPSTPLGKTDEVQLSHR